MYNDNDQLERLGAELDAVHARAQEAYRNKDLAGYIGLFAPEMAYKQPDGKVIGKETLTRQVKQQFANVRAVGSSYTRESLEMSNDEAVELLTQEAWADVIAFFVVRLRWRVHRRGRYHWRKSAAGWQIARVEVLSETMKTERR